MLPAMHMYMNNCDVCFALMSLNGFQTESDSTVNLQDAVRAAMDALNDSDTQEDAAE
jgi:hypothetical protein